VLQQVELGGCKKVGDEAFNEIFHPVAIRLLKKWWYTTLAEIPKAE
jgi:hypothetical protein